MEQLELIHPGEILREEFAVPLGLSAHGLARAMRVPVTRINDILHGKRAITADTALRLARYFGTSVEMWMQLQMDYEVRVARRLKGAEIEADVRPMAA